MKFQLSHLRKRLGLLFSSFFLLFSLRLIFFFQEEHGWVCIVFFCWGREESYFYINQSLFFLLSENINLSLSIRRLMYVAVIISMQYFLFLTANSRRGLDNDFFSYKKLVNWVSFYSSGKIEGYFFSFNVIFVIWPIKFPLKFEFLVWVFCLAYQKQRDLF